MEKQRCGGLCALRSTVGFAGYGHQRLERLMGHPAAEAASMEDGPDTPANGPHHTDSTPCAVKVIMNALDTALCGPPHKRGGSAAPHLQSL